MDPQYSGKLLDKLGSTPPQLDAISANQRTLAGAVEAIVGNDFAGFAQFLTDDAELEIRGLPRLDGKWQGRDQVTEAARTNFGILDEQKPEIEGMIAQNDTIAVLLRENGVFKADHCRYHVRAVQWFTFENGKIRKILEICADVSK